MRLYLDASIIVPLALPEAASLRIEAWLRGRRDELIVSDLANAEFHAAIAKRVRMGQLAEDTAAELYLRFEQWRDEATQALENLPIDIRAAARLVRQPSPKLLTPDAIHLATCRRLQLTLVSHDHAMIEIATREGIAALSPS